jgi:hypothetical protein
MKWLPILFSLCLVFLAAPVLAQAPATEDIQFSRTISVGEVTPTPEMWFYQQQMAQYEDPKVAVRQKAEERAAQRRGRIAARRWFGFSNIRPRAGTDVIHGDYSPSWSSGVNNYPFRWTGSGASSVVVRPVQSTSVY